MGPEEIREAANINCLIVFLKAFKVSMKKKIIIASQQILGDTEEDILKRFWKHPSFEY